MISRLGGRTKPFDRYRLLKQVGEGAMGQIYKARDEDLHRDLAMKVMKPSGDKEGATPRSPSPSRHIARFVEEAQITGQLDHPGVVPVHELGLDPQGRLYFTMKLVRGRTLREVFDLAWKREDGWSMTRVLGVLLKVCEAMSYAHEHKVIHRDLKPSNIMVGRFGEVFVMDWGLARLLDKPDARDIRVRQHVGASSTEFVSERHDATPSTPDSPLMTMDGDVLGTPAYMSPEQASGHVERVGIQTDVYAIGAILYHLLTQRMPYVEPGVRVDNYAVWRWVQSGPPTAVETLAPETPMELAAICAKAMEREPMRRYANASELAEDLRAYLENRVVRAHRVGPLVELRKWVARNQGTAVLTCAIILLITGAALTFGWQARRQAQQALLAGDALHAADLLRQSAKLSAARPDSATRIDSWLHDARALVQREPKHEQRLGELIESARQAGTLVESPFVRPPDLADAIDFAVGKAASWREFFEQKRAAVKDGKLDGDELDRARIAIEVMPAEIAFWEARARRIAPAREVTRRIPDPTTQSLNEQWTALLDDIRILREQAIPRAEARLATARSLREVSIDRESSKWQEAIHSIKDVAQCPVYKGLTISPQLGLVPLARDPASGLWEFWHVLSGDRPQRNVDGAWVIGPTTGMVLVLIPGATADIGADAKDPSAAHYDPNANTTESPTRVELAPYFISKYEMTQGQWVRETDEMPSKFFSGQSFGPQPRVTRSNPVESVSWSSCDEVLRRLGLVLPTEAQWEHAARAGVRTPYPCGTDPDCLTGTVNSADQTLQKMTTDHLAYAAPVEDGFNFHAPVGSFPPNGFGLHEILGNVAEWCRDWYTDSCDKTPALPPDGLRTPTSSRARVYRGGSFYDSFSWMRLSHRFQTDPQQCLETIGVRAARPLDP